MSDETSNIIDALNLPDIVKEDLKRDYAKRNPEQKTINTKSMVRMSSDDGRKATIVLWQDETVTVIATDRKGHSHVSTAKSPDMYYIAQKNYIDQGLEIEYAEDEGKEIGIR